MAKRICEKCHLHDVFGHGPAKRCIACLLTAKLIVDETGRQYGIEDLRTNSGRLFAAKYRYRLLNGNWYVYLRWFDEFRRHQEKYLGPAAGRGDPYELPTIVEERRWSRAED